MKKQTLFIATAALHFSEIYHVEHRDFYAFDITFDKASTLLFYHLELIPAGRTKDEAEKFLNAVKKYFSRVGIQDGSDVALFFSSSGRVLAISGQGNGLWIDVREGIFPRVPPKKFGTLGIPIHSLVVF